MKFRARYLVRFDDLCPGMNWNVWFRLERVLLESGCEPLLAVVPDNQDPALNVAVPRADFWDHVRAWQRRGWAIGLHGYQHLYTSTAAGLLHRNHYSEFAGLAQRAQEAKLRAGLEKLRREGVRADCFVAPAHSFDRTTLDLLVRHGVDCLSDGYSLEPFRCGRGLLWVPQQMACFRPLPFGTWTICLHFNDWRDADLERFRGDLLRYHQRLTRLAEIRREFAERREQWLDRALFASLRAARSWRS
jgi:hypothetical protein